MAGGNRNVDYMLDVAKEVFAELGVKDAKVAVIGAELDPEIVIKELRAGALRPTGAGPDLQKMPFAKASLSGRWASIP